MTQQQRPPLDKRHKLLIGACFGCLALGYLMGVWHIESHVQSQIVGSVLTTLNQSHQRLDQRQHAFDKTFDDVSRRHDERGKEWDKRFEESRKQFNDSWGKRLSQGKKDQESTHRRFTDLRSTDLRSTDSEPIDQRSMDQRSVDQRFVQQKSHEQKRDKTG
tara:strand:- start:53 stop:535 length:483 start_codon:yes stop_codon:yes gene_type:complete